MTVNRSILSALSAFFGVVFLAPIAVSAGQSKNVSKAAVNYVHRKGVRASRSVRHQHKNLQRYAHRKRAHIKDYLDKH